LPVPRHVPLRAGIASWGPAATGIINSIAATAIERFGSSPELFKLR
jgi:hypothetical protein